MKKKSSQFQKFFSKKSNAAIKEEFRQEKKKWKKEREEYFEKKKSQKAEVGSQKAEVGSQKSEVGSLKSEVGSRKLSGQNLPRPTSDIRHQTSGFMPLNKFIAHCGVCSRRDAAEMVKVGKVKVNGEAITEPGHKVSGKDDIRVNGKKIFLAKNLVYILLNKPKDFITTTEDPQGRKTVLDLIKRATAERVYPVGRLDRNTSGVLLLTNDGELAQKLTHPSNEIKKVYAVTLNKPLEKKDFDQVLKGIVLDDGPASIDKLAFTDTKDKTQLGVELHSGRNRIVRRIFEHLGYEVKQLDRVMFGGLTKKNVERGKWRYLNEKEVRGLKYFGKGK